MCPLVHMYKDNCTPQQDLGAHISTDKCPVGYICSRKFVLPGKIIGCADILGYEYSRYTFSRITVPIPLSVTLIRRYTYVVTAV